MMEPGGGGMGAPMGVTKVGGLTYNNAALLCYVPVMGIGFIASLVFLFTEPRESRFVRFHAIQELSLLGATLGLFVVLGCCVGIGFPLMASAGQDAAAVMGIVVVLVSLMPAGAGLGVLALHVWLMIKAYQNEMWKIPVIGNIAESQTR